MAGIFSPTFNEGTPNRPVTGPVETGVDVRVNQQRAERTLVEEPEPYFRTESTTANFFDSLGPMVAGAMGTLFEGSKSTQTAKQAEGEALKPYMLELNKIKQNGGNIRNYEKAALNYITQHPEYEKEILSVTKTFSGFDFGQQAVDPETIKMQAFFDWVREDPEGQDALVRAQGDMGRVYPIYLENLNRKATVAKLGELAQAGTSQVDIRKNERALATADLDDQIALMEAQLKVGELDYEQRVQVEKQLADMTARRAQMATDNATIAKAEPQLQEDLAALEEKKRNRARKEASRSLESDHYKKVQGLALAYLANSKEAFGATSFADLVNNEIVLQALDEEILRIEMNLKSENGDVDKESYDIDHVLSPIKRLREFLTTRKSEAVTLANALEAQGNTVLMQAFEKITGIPGNGSEAFSQAIMSLAMTSNSDAIRSLIETPNGMWTIKNVMGLNAAEVSAETDPSVTIYEGYSDETKAQVKALIENDYADEIILGTRRYFESIPVEAFSNSDIRKSAVRNMSIALATYQQLEAESGGLSLKDLNRQYTPEFIRNFNAITKVEDQDSDILRKQVETHISRNIFYRMSKVEAAVKSSSVGGAYLVFENGKWEAKINKDLVRHEGVRREIAEKNSTKLSDLTRTKGAFRNVQDAVDELNAVYGISQKFDSFKDSFKQSANEFSEISEKRNVDVIDVRTREDFDTVLPGQKFRVWNDELNAFSTEILTKEE